MPKAKRKTTKKKIVKKKEVEFVTPMYFLIWIIFLIGAYIVSLNFAQDDCLWQTTNVNEEGLMNACGMGYEDYMFREDLSYCPEGENFIEKEKVYCMNVRMGIIYVFLIAASIIYNLLYIIYYINRKKKSEKRK